MQYRDKVEVDEERLRRQQERRREEKRKRLKKRRRMQLALRVGVCAFGAALLTGTVVFIKHIANAAKPVQAQTAIQYAREKYVAEAPDIAVEFLDINEYSRPGEAIEAVNGIVVHYTGNPGTTAEQNRNYFQSLAETGETYASSHFIVGISGEIIQCIPCNEKSYASNDRNIDTISIECCIPDETGKFTDETYQSLIELTTWLMGCYDLGVDDVIRHYDVTGKECPRYYVRNESAWIRFKVDLNTYIDTYGIEKKEEIN